MEYLINEIRLGQQFEIEQKSLHRTYRTAENGVMHVEQYSKKLTQTTDNI